MVSERSYKKAKSIEEAIVEFEKSSGTQFDPELTKIFIDEVITPIITNVIETDTSVS